MSRYMDGYVDNLERLNEAKIERIAELERENAALRVQVEELDAKWKMAEAHCFDQVGKIGELKRENDTLRLEVKVTRQNYEEYKSKNAALRNALREIADASGFDNIGNWARNKAKDALEKEAQP